MAKRSRFGNVRKLPSGRWQARYVHPDTGLTINAPITYEAAEDADVWLSTQRADLARGTWKPPTPKRAKALTFGEYAENWLKERDLKPRTADHYRTILDRFLLPTFSDLPLAGITPEMVRTWHARLITGKTYRAHAYSLLRTITRTAVTDGHIATSPCVISGAGKGPKPRGGAKFKLPTLDELAKIVQAMPDNLRLMVLLAAWCALRFGELAELRRKDIDLAAGVIRVRRGVTWVDGEAIIGPPKSDAGKRDVTIPPHLMPLVKAHLRDHAGLELIFPSPRGHHITSTMLYDAWWPAREEAGRPDLHFHDLRHLGAVLAAQSGATVKELMARLGHSTAQMAMEYQHVAQDRDAIIAAKLSEIATRGK